MKAIGSNAKPGIRGAAVREIQAGRGPKQTNRRNRLWIRRGRARKSTTEVVRSVLMTSSLSFPPLEDERREWAQDAFENRS